MIQRPTAPPRGPRHGSPSIRGGGIQKRRSGPVRVDKDGDLDMDGVGGGRGKSGRGRFESPPTGPRGRGRAAPARGGNLGTQKAQQAIIRGLGGKQANVLDSRISKGGSSLQVDGLKSSRAASNADGGLDSLLAFLERKAAGLDSGSNRTVKIKKSHMVGDSVIISASQEDIDQIAKLDNFQFAGASLAIKRYEPFEPQKKQGISPNASELKEKFRAILASRYDADLKLLNLSSLAQEAGLLQMGLGAFDGKTTSKLFPAMMAVADELFKTWQEKRDAIVSVSLAMNGLSDVYGVAALAQTFPDIKNLDLSSNNIQDLRSIQSWRYKLKNLETLVLAQNPVENLPTLQADLMKWFPKLQILNFVQIRTPAEIAVALEAVNSPIPISGPDFRDVSQVGEHFIRQFIPLYDNDRGALLSTFYDAQSVFSLAINMSAPLSREHSKPIPSWEKYVRHSRNLVKITHPGPRMHRRYKGAQSIQVLWSELPVTRHPDLDTESIKYMIECQPLPGLADPTGQSFSGVDGLMITMHGEFQEQDPSAKDSLRSFSRTFVLGPGGPGGPPIRVVNDMMALRGWAPLAIPAATLAARQASPPTIPATEQQQKEVIAGQLMEKTGMTMEYAVLCLDQTGWQLEAAYAAFLQNRDKLPPNAFIAGMAV